MITICPSCRAENEETADTCFTCGKPFSALVKGAVVASRYEILSPLGKGGMGIVYKAHDRELEEDVALKVLRADIGAAHDMARRFRSEIKLARKVRHPNVCAIHEYGQDGPLLFIAMELIDGVDLKQLLLREGPLAPGQAYDLAAQIADGLQAIHDEGIIHRDLKTTNVMLDRRGAVRLMDFGIAKRWQAEGESGMTGTGQILGTPEYMSPEQVRGEKIDYRSDVYALGVVVFELFTGRVPFRGDTPAATILKHLQEPPPLQGPPAARLPAEVLPVLRKALAKKPADRFPKARLMAHALREAGARDRAASTAIPMPTATIALPPTTAVPRHAGRRLAIGGLAAAALLAAAVAVYRRQPEGTVSSTVARPAPPPTAAVTLPPAPTVTATAAATPATEMAPPPVTTRAAGEVRAPALKAAQAALGRGDYDVAVRQAQAAVQQSRGGAEAQALLARARGGQKAEGHIRAAEAALDRRDLGLASKEMALARGDAPWEPRLGGISARLSDLERQGQRESAARVNEILDRAEKALEAQRFEEAIGLYDEALKRDASNQVARMGRLTALNGRSAAAQAGVPRAPGKAFVSGKTLAQSVETRSADSTPPGFEPASGITVTRSTQAAALPGLILFEVAPPSVKPGDKYTVKVVFVNGGPAPIEIRTMTVATVTGGGRSGGPVTPLTKVVAPRDKAILLAPEGVWKEDVTSWSMEVAVHTAAGETYRNTLTWK